MNNITVKIYKLIDPKTLEIRYIGKTIECLKDRLSKHCCSSKLKRTHKECWIYSLMLNNLKPIIELIEEVSFDDWQKSEKYWIKFYRRQNPKLTNFTNGGEQFGNRIGYKHSEETKRKIGLSALGRKQTDYQKKMASEANKRPKTAEHCKNISKNKCAILDKYDYIVKEINEKDRTLKNLADELKSNVTTVWRVYNKKLKCQT